MLERGGLERVAQKLASRALRRHEAACYVTAPQRGSNDMLLDEPFSAFRSPSHGLYVAHVFREGVWPLTALVITHDVIGRLPWLLTLHVAGGPAQEVW